MCAKNNYNLNFTSDQNRRFTRNHTYTYINTQSRLYYREKEDELSILTTKVATLQEELESGAPTERKILAIAKSQALREHTHSQRSDVRELAFTNQQQKIAELDMYVAELLLKNERQGTLEALLCLYVL